MKKSNLILAIILSLSMGTSFAKAQSYDLSISTDNLNLQYRTDKAPKDGPHYGRVPPKDSHNFKPHHNFNNDAPNRHYGNLPPKGHHRNELGPNHNFRHDGPNHHYGKRMPHDAPEFDGRGPRGPHHEFRPHRPDGHYGHNFRKFKEPKRARPPREPHSSIYIGFI